jgi:hypothetical protein
MMGAVHVSQRARSIVYAYGSTSFVRMVVTAPLGACR